MCIYFSFLLFYQCLGVQLKWAMSGTCYIPASSISATALHRFMSRKNFILLHEGLQVNNVPRFCRQWDHQPKKYLDKDKIECVDKEKTECIDKEKTECIDKDKTECVDKDKVLIPRSGEAAPTPCSRPSRRNDAAPAPRWRPSYAAMTPLPRRVGWRAGWAGMGRLQWTFIQPERVYVTAE